MYKVFVVEDEPIIRQNIRNSIDSDNPGFVFCGEASDGEMALSMMQDIQPDILISDIKMPFMDGLELSRHAKSMMPWIKVLIISGHDEFEFAQEAISIGVERYLLKPLRQQELKEALNSVANQIENEKRSASVSGYTQNELHQALYQQFMHDLYHGKRSTAQLLEQAKLLKIELLRNVYQLAVIHIDDPDKEESSGFSLRFEIDKIFETMPMASPWFNGSNQLVLLIYGDSEENVVENTYRLLKIIQHEASERNLVLSSIIGNTINRISSIKNSYKALDSLLKNMAGLFKGQIIDVNDQNLNSQDTMLFRNSFSKEYEQKLLYATKESLPEILDNFKKDLKDDKYNSVLYRYYTLMDILGVSIRIVSDGEDDSKFTDNFGNLFDIFKASGSKKDFENTALKMLTLAVETRSEHVQHSKNTSIIHDAEEYVKENYNSPDISLHSVAKYAGFSPAHFSTLFSQKTKISFIEFLTEYRMEKAKEFLLHTNMKLSTIAMEIGYNEPNYFSYVFKKNTGLSPKEFRAQYNK